MNPLTNVKNINKLNETELAKGTVDKKSWHDLYKDSAWIFIGGLAYGLTEGDILCVFSQYGEIVNLNHVRDKKTGKTKGFCFLCYANQKSTILAVDNLNGIKLCGRTIRVDHVANYKPPKDNEQDDEITRMLKSEGCAPKPVKAEYSPSNEVVLQKKKNKKHKKEKKKHKKRKREGLDEEFSLVKVKKEKVDEGYSKYEFPEKSKNTVKKNESAESKSSDDSSDSDSNHISRQEKPKSQNCDKNYSYTEKKHSRYDSSRVTNKHERHYVGSSKYKRRKESGSSSEPDSHSNRKRKSPDTRDRMNGLSSERKNMDHDKDKGRNPSHSSSDEFSERHKMSHKILNRDHNVKSNSSRNHHYDSSSGSERNYFPPKNNRNSGKEQDKHGRSNFVEREENSYKDRRQYDHHISKESSHKVGHHHHEKRNYGEKYGRFDKDRGNKKEY